MPSDFCNGRSTALLALREKALKRHHLAQAYRLLSAISLGAMLATDLIFFQSRGGAFGELDENDLLVLHGDYFAERLDHILGTEVGKDPGEGDQTSKSRWGHQVVGTFERLPEFVNCPMCGTCEVVREVDAFAGASQHVARTSQRVAARCSALQRIDRPAWRGSSTRATPGCRGTPRAPWP